MVKLKNLLLSLTFLTSFGFAVNSSALTTDPALGTTGENKDELEEIVSVLEIKSSDKQEIIYEIGQTYSNYKTNYFSKMPEKTSNISYIVIDELIEELDKDPNNVTALDTLIKVHEAIPNHSLSSGQNRFFKDVPTNTKYMAKYELMVLQKDLPTNKELYLKRMEAINAVVSDYNDRKTTDTVFIKEVVDINNLAVQNIITYNDPDINKISLDLLSNTEIAFKAYYLHVSNPNAAFLLCKEIIKNPKNGAAIEALPIVMLKYKAVMKADLNENINAKIPKVISVLQENLKDPNLAYDSSVAIDVLFDCYPTDALPVGPYQSYLILQDIKNNTSQDNSYTIGSSELIGNVYNSYSNLPNEINTELSLQLINMLLPRLRTDDFDIRKSTNWALMSICFHYNRQPEVLTEERHKLLEIVLSDIDTTEKYNEDVSYRTALCNLFGSTDAIFLPAETKITAHYKTKNEQIIIVDQNGIKDNYVIYETNKGVITEKPVSEKDRSIIKNEILVHKDYALFDEIAVTEINGSNGPISQISGYDFVSYDLFDASSSQQEHDLNDNKVFGELESPNYNAEKLEDKVKALDIVRTTEPEEKYSLEISEKQLTEFHEFMASMAHNLGYGDIYNETDSKKCLNFLADCSEYLSTYNYDMVLYNYDPDTSLDLDNDGVKDGINIDYIGYVSNDFNGIIKTQKWEEVRELSLKKNREADYVHPFIYYMQQQGKPDAVRDVCRNKTEFYVLAFTELQYYNRNLDHLTVHSVSSLHTNHAYTIIFNHDTNKATLIDTTWGDQSDYTEFSQNAVDYSHRIILPSSYISGYHDYYLAECLFDGTKGYYSHQDYKFSLKLLHKICSDSSQSKELIDLSKQKLNSFSQF